MEQNHQDITAKNKQPINGTLIYQPKGPAGEYAKWAINLCNGCSNGCEYCYNRRGVLSHAFGDEPKLAAPIKELKEKLVRSYVKTNQLTSNQIKKHWDWMEQESIYEALAQIFEKDVNKIGLERLRKEGIFLSFKCDPFEPSTTAVTTKALTLLIYYFKIPVTILTKNTAWLDDEDSEIYTTSMRSSNLLTIGFTITGMDEMEGKAPSTAERINALERVKAMGYKTFVSMEPIVKFCRAKDVLMDVMGETDEIRLGLQSPFKKDRYEPDELIEFLQYLVAASRATPETKVVLKKSFFDERLYRQIPAHLHDDYMQLVNELKCNEPL